MNINFKWTITNQPTKYSESMETYFLQKNIFSTITIDCTNGVHDAVLDRFSYLIVEIIGSAPHSCYSGSCQDPNTKIASEAHVLINKNLEYLLMNNIEKLNKEGFIFY